MAKTAVAQDVQPKGILDRVQAFVNLKFPQTISELQHVRGQQQVKDIERDQLLEMNEFFLDQLDYEDAVAFMQHTFQNLRRNRLIKDGQDPGPLENEPDISKLIKFKPAHDSFRRLQETYVDARLFLTELIMKGKRRYEDVQRELEAEEKQFKQMADQFMGRDGKLTDKIIEETKQQNQAANTRKREILKLFNEVQSTQNTLNQNLLAELKF